MNTNHTNKGVEKEKLKTHLKRLLTLFITFSIISILIISGPASALIVNLTSNTNEVDIGEQMTFEVSIEVSNEEYDSLQSLIFILDGPIRKECVFDLNGNFLSICDGITNIQKAEVPTGYGYNGGYGYGYTGRNLTYIITFSPDTNFLEGDYTPIIRINHSNGFILRDSGIVSIISSDQNNTSNNTETRRDRSGGIRTTHLYYATDDYSVKSSLISSGDTYSFDSEMESHSFKVSEISENSIVIQTDDGRVLRVDLENLGQIDLNEDGVADVMINVLYIGDEVASVSFSAINGRLEKVEKSETSAEIISESQYENNFEVRIEDDRTTAEKERKNKIYDIINKFYMIIWLVLACLIVLELIAITSVYRR